MKGIRQYRYLILLLLAWLPLSCAPLKQAMQLAQVKFTLDHVSSVRVGGIDLMHVRSVDEINMFEVARATLAFSRGNLPLDLTVHVKTENPLINSVAASLVAMDWTLLLDGRETISGTINDSVELPAGQAQTIALKLRLNMVDFFNDKKALDLLDLALAVAGEGGRLPQNIALKIRPTIQTPFGLLHYKESIIKPGQ